MVAIARNTPRSRSTTTPSGSATSPARPAPPRTARASGQCTQAVSTAAVYAPTPIDAAFDSDSIAQASVRYRLNPRMALTPIRLIVAALAL